MNAWGWMRLPGPEFGTAGETLECPSALVVLAATPCPATGERLARVLEPQGHRLELAADPGETLDRFAKSRPDLVLLDEGLCPQDDFGLPLRLKGMVGTKR